MKILAGFIILVLSTSIFAGVHKERLRDAFIRNIYKVERDYTLGSKNLRYNLFTLENAEGQYDIFIVNDNTYHDFDENDDNRDVYKFASEKDREAFMYCLDRSDLSKSNLMSLVLDEDDETIKEVYLDKRCAQYYDDFVKEQAKK